jgi:hypothetical protein
MRKVIVNSANQTFTTSTSEVSFKKPIFTMPFY